MADGNGQAIELAKGADLRTDRAAFEPTNMEQALHLATKLCAGGLVPTALRKPEAALTAIIMGRELGLTAMQAVRSIHVIEGKPALSSALIVALCKRATDVCRYFRLVESTDTIATCETHRVGEPEPTRMSFTIAQATKAGVTGKNTWKQYPAAMLRARCETALARAVYPDLVMGLYDPDELEPTTAPRDVTPAPAPRSESARPAPVRPAPVRPAPVVEVLPREEPAQQEAEAGEPETHEPEPQTEPEPEPMGHAAASYLRDIEHAATPDELRAVGKTIKAASESGEITPEEKAALHSAYAVRQAAVR